MKRVDGSPDEPIRAVIYGAKSTEDVGGSIPTQITDCESAIEREWEPRQCVGVFQDEGKSAYTGNRGPGLTKALATAAAEARKYGKAELWVQHSDRLARGDGKQSAHLIHYVVDCERINVNLRSVQDDESFKNYAQAANVGQRNHEDSQRKSNAVKSGKERQFARGEHLGGPTPDGYKKVKWIESDGSVRCCFETHPTRADLIASIFDMSENGMSDASIARKLNKSGLRTQGGRSWVRRRLQSTLTNPFYAGRVARNRGPGQDEEITEGTHPALIEPSRFDAIQSMRPLRDLAKGKHDRVGRPNRRHLLSRVATCGHCGSRMYCVTSSYVPKHRPRRLTYECANYRESTGLCAAPPVDARLVDATLSAHLPSLLLSFDDWAEALASTGSDLRRATEEALAAARADLKSQEFERSGLLEQIARASHEDESWQRTLADADNQKCQRIGQIKHQISEMEAILDEEPSEEAADSVVATMLRIEAALLDGADDPALIPSANEALREVFERILLITEPDGSVALDFHFTEEYDRLGVLVFDSSARDWAKIYFVGVKAKTVEPIPARIRPEDLLTSQKLSNSHG